MIDPLSGEEILSDGRPLTEPDALIAYEREIRARLALKPRGTGQIKSPQDLIDDLEFAKWAAGQAAWVIKEAEVTHVALKKRYTRALVAQLRNSELKAADERRMEAEIELAPLKDLLDAAEIALSYAKRMAGMVEDAKSITQTQAKLVMTQLGLAGTGRGYE